MAPKASLTPVGQSVPINNFVGTLNVPARALADAVQGVDLRFDATTPSMQNPALRFELQVFFSPDSGQTWRFLMGATFDGGAKDRAGNPLAEYYRQIPFPPDTPDGQRQIKATLTNNSGVALTTTATLSTF